MEMLLDKEHMVTFLMTSPDVTSPGNKAQSCAWKG